MVSKTTIDRGFKKTQGITYPLGKRLYSLKEASIYLGRPVYSMRVLIWNGSLPVVRDGKKLYVDIVDMEKWIDRNKTTVV